MALTLTDSDFILKEMHFFLILVIISNKVCEIRKHFLKTRRLIVSIYYFKHYPTYFPLKKCSVSISLECIFITLKSYVLSKSGEVLAFIIYKKSNSINHFII